MSRQLEQALLSLMPTLSQALPASLLELASSYLTLSRLKASTLRADEEIARPYACAHLACDRLKLSLDLPPIEPRPPIAPRPYNRLYTHLATVMPHSSLTTTPRRTPGKTARTFTTPTSARSRAADSHRTTPRTPQTPSLRGVAGFGPASGIGADTPSRTATLRAQELKRARTRDRSMAGSTAATHALPAWIKPTTRWICAHTARPHHAPTVLAGMETIVAPGGRRTKDAWLLQNLSGLLAAIFYSVVVRSDELTALDADVESDAGSDTDPDQVDDETSEQTSEQTTEQRAIAAVNGSGKNSGTAASHRAIRQRLPALFLRARRQIDLVGGQEAGWDGFIPPSVADIDTALEEIARRRWQSSDWFDGLRDLVTRPARAHLEHEHEHEPHRSDDDDDEDGDEYDDAPGRRADAMLQPHVDYLSEPRRADYGAWKEDVLGRIRSLVASQPS